MINITKYHTKYNPEEGIYYVWAYETIICPICGCLELRAKGWRKRGVITLDDGLHVLKIRRIKCTKCNKIHHVLPDTIVPYKRHGAETIEIIIKGGTSAAYCENSTINRIKAWWREMINYILFAALAIKEKYKVILSPRSKLAEIVRALVNTHLWPRTRSACAPG